MDELQQPVGLRVFRTVLGYGGQNDLRMRSQHGEFDVQRRVEHHVGRFLIGEYPLVFGLTHVFPLGNGLLGGIGTLVVVADDTAQQSVVADGNPVVVVDGDTGEGGYIYLVFQRVGQFLCQ